ncbi:YrdB family protein [Haloarchaeobius amylolyticus]|uniref:YrdB family protein n=1 Tax=Haloarchaeobius amylolyticus TaxID=1198296 RepID=UPI002271C424|nr:YrdB family protein [Haloarchaeobius amylolyticus]
MTEPATHADRLGGLGLLVVGTRFLLELAALAALGYWGFRTGDSTLASYGLGLGAPAVAALVWGTFVAPKARLRLRGTARLAVEAAVFASAAVALVLAGEPTLAAIFAVVATVDRAAVAALGLESY